MYFYSIRPLKRRLATGPLSEAESLPYLVVFLAASAIASSLPGELENVWDWTDAILTVGLAVVGTWILYRANGGADGRDFVQRYIVLGWVVTLCFFTLVLPALFLFAWTGRAAGFVSETSTVVDVVVSFVIQVSFLVYFGLHLDDLRQLTAAHRGEPSPSPLP